MSPSTSPSDAVSTWEEAIALTPGTEKNTYVANLQKAWCIGTVPHGGYLTSLFLACARFHLSQTQPNLNQPHAITTHMTFLRRTHIGQALLSVSDAKLGSRTSTLHITLSQIDSKGKRREEIASYITMSNIDTEDGISVKTGYKLDPTPLPIDFSSLSAGKEDTHGNWRLVHNKHPNFRKATNHNRTHVLQRGVQTVSGEMVHDEWMQFAPYGTVTKWDDISLGYLVDMFPLVLEGKEMAASMKKNAGAGAKPGTSPFWFPTLTLSVEVKKSLGAGVEWLFVRARQKVVRNGRMDVELVVVDAEGDVVAVSWHTCLILSAERNLTREGSGKVEAKL